jgi:hypothetical protein
MKIRETRQVLKPGVQGGEARVWELRLIDLKEAEGGGEEVRRSAIEVRMPFRRNPRDAIARADP